MVEPTALWPLRSPLLGIQIRLGRFAGDALLSQLEPLRPLEWGALAPWPRKKISDFMLRGCSFGSFPESSTHLQL